MKNLKQDFEIALLVWAITALDKSSPDRLLGLTFILRKLGYYTSLFEMLQLWSTLPVNKMDHNACFKV